MAHNASVCGLLSLLPRPRPGYGGTSQRNKDRELDTGPYQDPYIRIRMEQRRDRGDEVGWYGEAAVDVLRQGGREPSIIRIRT